MVRAYVPVEVDKMCYSSGYELYGPCARSSGWDVPIQAEV